VQLANPFAHLIEPLDGPGRYLVRLVESIIAVHASSTTRYKFDSKHFFKDAMRLCLSAAVVGIRCLV